MRQKKRAAAVLLSAVNGFFRGKSGGSGMGGFLAEERVRLLYWK